MTTVSGITVNRRDALRALLGRLDPGQRRVLRSEWTVERGKSLLIAQGIAEADATQAELADAYEAADREFAELAPDEAVSLRSDDDDQVRAGETLEAYRVRMHKKHQTYGGRA